MASASSAHRRCYWEHPAHLPLPVAVSTMAVSVGAAFAARAWGLVGVWAFIRTATADTIPTTATPAFAMRFGSASGRATVGEYAASRSASNCGCPTLRLSEQSRTEL